LPLCYYIIEFRKHIVVLFNSWGAIWSSLEFCKLWNLGMRKCDLKFQALCQICLWGHVFPLGLLELLVHIPIGDKQGRFLYVMNKTQSHGKEGCSSYLILYQCSLHGQFPSLLDFIVLGQLHWSSATTYDGPIQIKDNFWISYRDTRWITFISC
jgi:hypothetical protein